MNGLRAAKTEDLVALRAAVASGELVTPITDRLLVAVGGFSSVVPCATALSSLSAEGVLAVLTAVIDERVSEPVGPRLVWSGPSAVDARAMGTAEALAELFQRATTSVLLAGYAFDHGERILEPLHAAMLRGAVVELYMHVDEAPDDKPEVGVKLALTRFFATHWTWPERPQVHYDPRTISGNEGRHASMHAKCVIVDERWSLIGSANFTDRGHTRNIEVGVLLDDPIFARELLRQFHSARELGVFVRAG